MSVSASSGARRKDGRWSHGGITRRADDPVAVRARSQARDAARAGDGPRRHALRHKTSASRTARPKRTQDCGWRSVSNVPHGFAVQSFTAELALRRARTRSVPARSDRTARILDVPQKVKDFWTTAKIGGLPDRHRAIARRRRTCDREGGFRAPSAERPWPWASRSSQLRELCGGGHRSRGRREGQRHRAASDIAVDCGDRQSGSCPLPLKGTASGC